MAHRHFSLENSRMRTIPHVNHRIVLHIGAVPDADVMNIPTHRAVAPNRGLFSEMHVAYYLSTGFDIRGRVNLRVNPTERSNHDFGKIVTQVTLGFVLGALSFVG